jgi:hypothetical protein
MFVYAFVFIATLLLVSLLGHNAYLIWYARSGRYELDQRLDKATK